MIYIKYLVKKYMDENVHLHSQLHNYISLKKSIYIVQSIRKHSKALFKFPAITHVNFSRKESTQYLPL